MGRKPTWDRSLRALPGATESQLGRIQLPSLSRWPNTVWGEVNESANASGSPTGSAWQRRTSLVEAKIGAKDTVGDGAKSSSRNGTNLELLRFNERRTRFRYSATPFEFLSATLWDDSHSTADRADTEKVPHKKRCHNTGDRPADGGGGVAKSQGKERQRGGGIQRRRCCEAQIRWAEDDH